MKILALETSAKSVSTAVVENGAPLAYAYQCTGLTHSRTLMPMVDAMLKNAELTLGDMAMIVLTATLASVGTAGVSGAGMIMLAMVLEAVGIPTTYIGIIYGIDRLFDMGRTALNVVGDASCAICVNHWEAKAAAQKAAK